MLLTVGFLKIAADREALVKGVALPPYYSYY
jgi:hypothetical protein